MKRELLEMDPSAAEPATCQRIVAAARRSFFANGFRSVTMDDLAMELGMSKKTLYAHFSSKTALLEAIFQEKFREIETELTRIGEESIADFAAGLQQLLGCFHRHTAEIQPAFVRDIQREAPEFFQKIARRRHDLIQQHFGKLLNEGRRQGLIRKDVPVHLIVEILLAATQAIMNPPRMAELGLTPASGFSAITSVILQGVITEEGRAGR